MGLKNLDHFMDSADEPPDRRGRSDGGPRREQSARESLRNAGQRSSATETSVAPSTTGTVVKLFSAKGFGFLRPSTKLDGDDAKDWFFHVSGVVGKAGVFSALVVGDTVEFTPSKDDQGRKRAIAVKKL